MAVLVDEVYGAKMRVASEQARVELAEHIQVLKSQSATRLNAIRCLALEVAHRRMVERAKG